MLWNWVNYKQNNWDEHLSAAEYACNNTKQASTGMLPFFLNAEQNPTMSVRFLLNEAEESEDKLLSTKDFIKRMADLLKEASYNLDEAQAWQKRNADKKRKDIEFEVDEQVLLSTKNIKVDMQKYKPTRKLQPCFIRPYKIIEVIFPVSYKFEVPQNMNIHPVFYTGNFIFFFCSLI